MIRYPISPDELRHRIEEASPGWLDDARLRTEGFRAAGRFTEGDAESSWSRIKAVYQSLQYNKCAYCERKLSDYAIEHDVEHYRPKRSVPAWSPQNALACPLGAAFPEGYFLLAYHPENYATACKPCNTNLKRNFFPIAAIRIGGRDHPTDYANERPYLPYPLGNWDADPEALIGFIGIWACPRPNLTEEQRWRALVTIAFFDLNGRRDLREGRCLAIERIDACHDAIARGDRHDKKTARQTLAFHLSPAAPHTNCARCYDALCRSDRPKAQEFAEMARSILTEYRVSRPARR